MYISDTHFSLNAQFPVLKAQIVCDQHAFIVS